MLAPSVGEVIAGRYRVLAEIGAGATSRVLRALDEAGPSGEEDPAASSRAGDVVAVKLFAPQSVEGTLEGRVRFRREARVLAALHDPAIVRILGLGEHDDAPYLTMELVEGGTLESLLARRSLAKLPPLPEAEVLRFLIELTRGLSFAHSRGITHRDLKPANVLLRVADDGSLRPTIADFGVAQLGEMVPGEAAWVIGTPGYMAPEQCHVVDGGADERSDLFALGIVAYELATGERPFRCDTLAVYIRELATRTLPRPSRKRAGLSPMLEALIGRLATRSPNARYHTARGVLFDLERIAKHDDGVMFELGRRDLRGIVAHRTSLVGRGDALASLENAWARACAGAGEVVVIEAPSGLGKTRLVEELAPQIPARNGVLLRGKSYEFEAPSPFRTLTEAVRDLLTQDSMAPHSTGNTVRLRASLRDLDDVILRVVPELEQLLGAVRARSPIPPDQELLRVREAYVRLFQALASPEHPLAIFLDDLQWSDEDALEVVRQLAREVAGHPILLILACRERDQPTSKARAPRSSGLSSLLHSLGDRVSFLPLAMLPNAGVTALIAGMLDGAPMEMTKLVAAHISIRAAGNPLFVEEQVRGLVADGIIAFDADVGWRCDAPKLANAEPPHNVVEAILARTARLSSAVKSVVEIAAVVGREVPFEILRELCPELAVDALVDALDEAVSAYLLTRTLGGDYVFTCDRAQSALYEAMAEETRLRLHVVLRRRLEALRERGRPVSSTDLLRHARATNDDVRALRYGVEAARDAWSVHAYLVASRLYEDAVALASGSQRDELRVELAETLVVVGRFADAVSAVTDSLATTATKPGRVRLLRVRAAAEFALGNYAHATEALEGALEADGSTVARDRLSVALSIGRTALALTAYKAKRLLAGDSETGAEVPSSRGTSSFSSDDVGVLDTLGRLYFFTDMWKLLDVSLRGYLRFRDSRNPGERFYIFASHAVLCQLLGLPARARVFGDRASSLEAHASLLERARGLPVLALYFQLRHDVEGGLTFARAAEDACIRAGDIWSLGASLDMQTSMSFARGDVVGAGRSADRFFAVIQEHDVRQRRARALLLSTYVGFVLGRLHGAACDDQLEHAKRQATTMGDELTAAAIAWMHADVSLAQGQLACAVEHAEEGYALVKKERRLHPDALLAVSVLVRSLVQSHASRSLERAERRRLLSLAGLAIRWGDRFPGLRGPGLAAKALALILIEGESTAARRAWRAAIERLTETGDAIRLASLHIERAALLRRKSLPTSLDEAREAISTLDSLGAHGLAAHARRTLSLAPSIVPSSVDGATSTATNLGPTIEVPQSGVISRGGSVDALSTAEVAKILGEPEDANDSQLATLRSASGDRSPR